MASAAIAHVFVFSAAPYQFLPVYENGKVTTHATKTEVGMEGDNRERPSVVRQDVEAPGTSVTESVQDVILGGGEHVVKDILLTITQAVEPLEKGVTKIQKAFHQINLGSKEEGGGPLVEVDEHVEEGITPSGDLVVSMEEEILADSGNHSQ